MPRCMRYLAKSMMMLSHGKQINSPRPPEYANKTRPFAGVDMVATVAKAV